MQDRLAAVSTGREAEPTPQTRRTLRMRKRQRLIDACISALHLYGPSRTTVEKVVAIANLSPGIVRFYFDSKDAMLVASLAYLATEFDERVLAVVSRLKSTPARALERLVELYFDPEIASPRKISVWYSFWGEASSRQEYQDICGKKDEDFAVLVRELIDGLMAEGGLHHLDGDAISLGLIGVLEMLWQGFAFQSEADIDRESARRRSLAYLGSVFPGMFPGATRTDGVGVGAQSVHRADSQANASSPQGSDRPLPPWVYHSAPLLELERERLLRPAWQVVGLDSQLARAGDYLGASWPWERALVVRGTDGRLHALRNACGRHPHALVETSAGRLSGALICTAHDLAYDFTGARLRGAPPGDLTRLEVAQLGPLVLVRSPLPAGVAAAALPVVPLAAWPKLGVGPLETVAVAADWKLIVEQWLEQEAPQQYFLSPNQLLDLSGHDARLLQVVPEAPGRARVVSFGLRRGRGGRASRAGSATRPDLAAQFDLAESTQRGIETLPIEREASAAASPALRRFRGLVTMLLPLVGAARSGAS